MSCATGRSGTKVCECVTFEYQLTLTLPNEIVLTDYPFARFNKGCVVVRYETEEEYAAIPPQSPAPSQPWTKPETDHLLHLCVLYDLRWDIIGDRYDRTPDRSITDLKFRYYHVAKSVISHRRSVGAQPKRSATQPPSATKGDISTGSSSATAPAVKGSENGEGAVGIEGFNVKLLKSGKISSKARTQVENEILGFSFNVGQEQLRLSQLNQQHSRTASEEREEQRILAEIRKVDAQIKRLHKEKKAKKGTGGNAQNDGKQAPLLDNAIVAEAKKKASMSPSRRRAVQLRSSRLIALPTSIGVGQRMLKKMSAFLSELGIPERPLPTGTICDAYDQLRQDSMKLLSLKNQLQKLKVELYKLKGVPMPVKPKVMPSKSKSERSKKRKAQGSGNSKKSSKKSTHSSNSTSVSPTFTTASGVAAGSSTLVGSQGQPSIIRADSAMSTASRSSSRVKKKKVK